MESFRKFGLFPMSIILSIRFFLNRLTVNISTMSRSKEKVKTKYLEDDFEAFLKEVKRLFDIFLSWFLYTYLYIL